MYNDELDFDSDDNYYFFDEEGNVVDEDIADLMKNAITNDIDNLDGLDQLDFEDAEDEDDYESL